MIKKIAKPMKRHIKDAKPQEKQRGNLTDGSLQRSILYLALPLISEAVIINIGRVLSTYWAARLGVTALASLTIGSIIYSVIKALANGLSVGGMSVIARRIGAGNQAEIEHAVWQMILLGLFVSFVVGSLGFFLARPLLVLLGADTAVLSVALPYLRIVFVGQFTFIILAVVNAMLRGAGEVRLTMKLLFIGTVVAVVIEPVLVFGPGPLPSLGVAGSAWATVLSFGVQLVLQAVIILQGRTRIRVNLRDLKPDFPLIGRVIRVALPSAVQTTLRSSSQLVIVGLVGAYGTQAMAAYGVGRRLLLLVTIPGIGLANTAGVLVGQNLGAYKSERAERSAWLSGAYASGYMAVMTVILFVFGRPIIALFNSTPQVLSEATWYVRIVAPSLVFSLLGLVLGRALSGAGDTMPPMALNLFTLWGVAAPLSYVLSKWLGLGVAGIWWGLAISNLTNGLLFAYWFHRGQWKQKKL